MHVADANKVETHIAVLRKGDLSMLSADHWTLEEGLVALCCE